MRHELATLEALIDREFFETEWAGIFAVADGPAGEPAAAGAGLL